jgi:hypothetical protein
MSFRSLTTTALALAVSLAIGSAAAAQSPNQLAISAAVPNLLSGTVTLSGANFVDNSDPAVRVWLNRVPLAIQSMTPTQVIAALPAGIGAGSYQLEMTRTNGNGGGNTSTNGPRYGAITLTIGAVGATGAQGPQGIIGPQGNQGPQGVAGPQGPKGDTGAPGAAGAQGETGFTGPTGPQGAMGAAGPQGVPGAPGVSGYEIVQSEYYIDLSIYGDSGQRDLYCPAGKFAVGGGGVIRTPGIITTEVQTLPMGTGHGWHFYMPNYDVMSKNVLLRVVCISIN